VSIDKERSLANWEENPGKIFNQLSKPIENAIKTRIALYEPLEHKTTVQKFLKWKDTQEAKILQEFLTIENSNPDHYLNDLVKHFLIETTYYYFLFEEQDLVEKFVVDISRQNGIPLTLSQAITLFVREKLENQAQLAAVKRTFKEGSKLKTYFYTLIRFLVFDYGRKYNVRVVSQEPAQLEKPQSSSLAPYLCLEAQEIKDRVAKLSPIEQVAFKMFYFENITNLSIIARTLKTSRHKSRKIIKKAVEKVIKDEV